MWRQPGCPDEARAALTDAIVTAITAEGSQSNELLARAFGGPTVIAGDDLSDLIAAEYAAAGELLEAVSE